MTSPQLVPGQLTTKGKLVPVKGLQGKLTNKELPSSNGTNFSVPVKTKRNKRKFEWIKVRIKPVKLCVLIKTQNKEKLIKEKIKRVKTMQRY